MEFVAFAAVQSLCDTVLSLRKGQSEKLPCPVSATVSIRAPMTVNKHFSPNLLYLIG